MVDNTPERAAPEQLKIGAQMANVMFNLAQRPGEQLTSDHVVMMDKLRKQWDAAVAWNRRSAAVPAVGEEQLPPHFLDELNDAIVEASNQAFAMRDWCARDHWRDVLKQFEDWRAGAGTVQQPAGTVSAKYDNVLASLVASYGAAIAAGGTGEDSYAKLVAHIDARTQLARQSQGEPVGEVEVSSGAEDTRVVLHSPLPAGTKLYAAPTLSSAPQGEHEVRPIPDPTADEANLYRDMTGDAMALGYDGIPAALEALRAAQPVAHPVAPVEQIRKAFMTLESSSDGAAIVLKFNQSADAYAMHDFLLKGGAQ
jgi:hypothetical protein